MADVVSGVMIMAPGRWIAGSRAEAFWEEAGGLGLVGKMS